MPDSLYRLPAYFEDARANEALFKEILQDFKIRFPKVLPYLNPGEDMEKILEGFSSAAQEKKSGVINFQVGPYEDSSSSRFLKHTSDQATIIVQDNNLGYVIKYFVKDQGPEYYCSSMVRINQNE